MDAPTRGAAAINRYVDDDHATEPGIEAAISLVSDVLAYVEEVSGADAARYVIDEALS